MLKKIFICLIIFLGCLTISEVTIRIMSRIGNFRRESLNNQSFNLSNKKNIILTIGESTTDDLMSAEGPEYSWPRILERRLREKKCDVSIVNLAKSGSTSAAQVQQVYQYFNNHSDPIAVISMMGINDYVTPFSLMYRPSKFAQLEFRTFHLVKSLWRNYVSMRQSKISNYCDGSCWQVIGENMPKWRKYLNQLTNDNAAISFINFIEMNVFPKLDPRNKSIALAIAAYDFELWAKEKHISFLPVSQKLFEMAKTDPEQTSFLVFFRIIRSGNPELCQKIVDIQNQKPLPHWDYIYPLLSQCLPVTKISKLLDEDFESTTKVSKENISYHYNLLWELTHQHNVPLLAMQYPTLKIDDLKNFFNKDSHNSSIYFIENYQNFDREVSLRGYEAVFFDRFGQTFGHATTLGNHLIVNNLYPIAVNTLLKNNICLKELSNNRK